MQTNEVQRSWALLPAFLAVADGRPLDLVELGPSAGLNLVWDRYRYRYGDQTWGDPGAELELAGETNGGPPAELLERDVRVRRRLGLDRTPIDVTTEEGALLLASFVWADQTHRLERLHRAVEVLRQDAPKLVAGDYLGLLPRVLRERDLDALTVVFHSVSLAYLPRADRESVRRMVSADGVRGALVHVSLEFDEAERRQYEGLALDVQVFPDGERRRLARADGHANRLRWVA